MQQQQQYVYRRTFLQSIINKNIIFIEPHLENICCLHVILKQRDTDHDQPPATCTVNSTMENDRQWRITREDIVEFLES